MLQAMSLCHVDSEWTLDLRQGETPSLVDGPPKTEPDLRVTINDDNFANLVSGKLGQQKVGSGDSRSTATLYFVCIVLDQRCAAGKNVPRQTCGVLSQAFLLGKLKIKGSMGMAMKLSPIIEAAAPPPQSKL
jgi:hypothetical protein